MLQLVGRDLHVLERRHDPDCTGVQTRVALQADYWPAYQVKVTLAGVSTQMCFEIARYGPTGRFKVRVVRRAEIDVVDVRNYDSLDAHGLPALHRLHQAFADLDGLQVRTCRTGESPLHQTFDEVFEAGYQIHGTLY